MPSHTNHHHPRARASRPATAVLLSGLALVAGASGFAGCGADLVAPEELGSYQLAFVAPSTSALYRFDIYRVSADGSELVNLTNHPASYYDLSWSPDGRQLAFISNRDRARDLYVMGADGTGLRNLTNGTMRAVYPAWSPDGSQIAFVDSDIYVVDATGENLKKLTDAGRYHELVWSPGARLVFSGTHMPSAASDLFLLNPDGTGFVNLTNTPTTFEAAPVWSPDGSRIAFYSLIGIQIIAADGTGLVHLTPDLEHTGHPTWSQDGSHIAFFRGGGSDYEVYSVQVEGGVPRNLSRNSADDLMPAWAPNSRWMAFTSDRTGAFEIWLANADGTAATQLTHVAVPRPIDGDGGIEFRWRPNQ
jgi:Tol biopolymer transport system component